MNTLTNTNNNIATQLVEFFWPYLESKLNEVLKAKTQAAAEIRPDWITKKEALKLLNMGATTLFKLCEDGYSNQKS